MPHRHAYRLVLKVLSWLHYSADWGPLNWQHETALLAAKTLFLGSHAGSALQRRAAVHYEQADYDACIADCDKAVERGRELRADYKLIAKALSRKGNALVKQDSLAEAISTYHKALTEHR